MEMVRDSTVVPSTGDIDIEAPKLNFGPGDGMGKYTQSFQMGKLSMSRAAGHVAVGCLALFHMVPVLRIEIYRDFNQIIGVVYTNVYSSMKGFMEYSYDYFGGIAGFLSFDFAEAFQDSALAPLGMFLLIIAAVVVFFMYFWLVFGNTRKMVLKTKIESLRQGNEDLGIIEEKKRHRLRMFVFNSTLLLVSTIYLPVVEGCFQVLFCDMDSYLMEYLMGDKVDSCKNWSSYDGVAAFAVFFIAFVGLGFPYFIYSEIERAAPKGDEQNEILNEEGEKVAFTNLIYQKMIREDPEIQADPFLSQFEGFHMSNKYHKVYMMGFKLVLAIAAVYVSSQRDKTDMYKEQNTAVAATLLLAFFTFYVFWKQPFNKHGDQNMEVMGFAEATLTALGGFLVLLAGKSSSIADVIGAVLLVITILNTLGMIYYILMDIPAITDCLDTLHGNVKWTNTVDDVTTYSPKDAIERWDLDKEVKHRVWHAFWISLFEHLNPEDDDVKEGNFLKRLHDLQESVSKYGIEYQTEHWNSYFNKDRVAIRKRCIELQGTDFFDGATTGKVGKVYVIPYPFHINFVNDNVLDDVSIKKGWEENFLEHYNSEWMVVRRRNRKMLRAISNAFHNMPLLSFPVIKWNYTSDDSVKKVNYEYSYARSNHPNSVELETKGSECISDISYIKFYTNTWHEERAKSGDGVTITEFNDSGKEACAGFNLELHFNSNGFKAEELTDEASKYLDEHKYISVPNMDQLSYDKGKIRFFVTESKYPLSDAYVCCFRWPGDSVPYHHRFNIIGLDDNFESLKDTDGNDLFEQFIACCKDAGLKVDEEYAALLEADKAYGAKFLAQYEKDNQILDDAFLDMVYDNPTINREELQKYLNEVEHHELIKSIPTEHKGGLDYIYNKMNFINSGTEQKIWYVFWDDFFTSNQHLHAVTSRAQYLDPSDSNSICYRYMASRKECSAYLKEIGINGCFSNVISDHVLDTLYNRLENPLLYPLIEIDEPRRTITDCLCHQETDGANPWCLNVVVQIMVVAYGLIMFVYCVVPCLCYWCCTEKEEFHEQWVEWIDQIYVCFGWDLPERDSGIPFDNCAVIRIQRKKGAPLGGIDIKGISSRTRNVKRRKDNDDDEKEKETAKCVRLSADEINSDDFKAREYSHMNDHIGWGISSGSKDRPCYIDYNYIYRMHEKKEAKGDIDTFSLHADPVSEDIAQPFVELWVYNWGGDFIDKIQILLEDNQFEDAQYYEMVLLDYYRNPITQVMPLKGTAIQTFEYTDDMATRTLLYPKHKGDGIPVKEAFDPYNLPYGMMPHRSIFTPKQSMVKAVRYVRLEREFHQDKNMDLHLIVVRDARGNILNEHASHYYDDPKNELENKPGKDYGEGRWEGLYKSNRIKKFIEIDLKSEMEVAEIEVKFASIEPHPNGDNDTECRAMKYERASGVRLSCANGLRQKVMPTINVHPRGAFYSVKWKLYRDEKEKEKLPLPIEKVLEDFIQDKQSRYFHGEEVEDLESKLKDAASSAAAKKMQDTRKRFFKGMINM